MEGTKRRERSVVAVDTGFFVALMRGHEQAKDILHLLKGEKKKPVISTLSIGELLYILYREGRNNESAKIIDGITKGMNVVDIDLKIAGEGARIKHEKRIPYVDSLIGATAIVCECKKLYTSDDKHMKVLADYGIDVAIIKE